MKKIIPIAFLDPSFFSCLSKQEDKEEIKKFMNEFLNIFTFSIGNYCIDILNTLKKSYKDLSPNQIIDATGFLAQNSPDDSSWNELPIILKNDEKKIIDELDGRSVLVPPKYDENTGWQNIWVENKEKDRFLILSDKYPNDTLSELIALCENKIRRYPDPLKIDRKGQLLNDYEKTILLKIPRSTREKTITNYRSPNILSAESISDRKSAFSILSFISNSNISDYKDAYGHYFYRTSHISYFDSEIFFNLKNCKWFPSSKGFVKPSQVFIPKKEIKEILGDTVPYFCEGELDDKSIELLEIKTELTLSKLIEVLNAYSGDDSVHPEMISRIYSEIDARTKFNNDSREETIDEFIENQLIFVPGENKIGKWCSIGDVLWEDAENVLGKDFIYIENFYPKLKEFFVGTLKIKEKADPESFANRWLKLQENPIQDGKKLKQVMENIYSMLLPIAKEKEQLRPEWWDDFASDVEIFAQDLSFETRREIVVPDDGELKKIFSKGEIKYAWRPEKDSFNQWVPFYEAFEIPRISRSVTIDLSEDTEIEIKPENEYITNSVILMIATWLRERDLKYYTQMQEDNFFDKLIAIKEAITLDTINVQFHLVTDWLAEDVESEYPIYWDRKNGILIINKNVSKSQAKRKISSVVAKGIMNNRAYKDLATWIEVILGAQSIERINDLSWSIPNEIKQKIKKIEKETIESKKKTDENVLQTPESNTDLE
ncbi:MAG: hypothetical protein U9N34_06830, partial [Candidatus Cloacimonadota bacterium]|nr:hypothetical protein [Candidatus Cloacimonadota bacterium]